MPVASDDTVERSQSGQGAYGPVVSEVTGLVIDGDNNLRLEGRLVKTRLVLTPLQTALVTLGLVFLFVTMITNLHADGWFRYPGPIEQFVKRPAGGPGGMGPGRMGPGGSLEGGAPGSSSLSGMRGSSPAAPSGSSSGSASFSGPPPAAAAPSAGGGSQPTAGQPPQQMQAPGQMPFPGQPPTGFPPGQMPNGFPPGQMPGFPPGAPSNPHFSQ